MKVVKSTVSTLRRSIISIVFVGLLSPTSVAGNISNTPNSGSSGGSRYNMCIESISKWTEQYSNYKLDSISSAHESRDKNYSHCVARLVKVGEYANAPLYFKFTHDKVRSVITARVL